MRGAGRHPRVMVLFLERLAKETGEHRGHMLPIVFSSQPANAERIAFFSQR